MTRVFAYHDVDDVEHWLASPKREEVFGPLGVTNIQTFVDPSGSNRVGVTMDIVDMNAVTAFMQTQEAADAMAHDGVHPDSMVMLGSRRKHVSTSPLHRTCSSPAWIIER